eukprot:COSAG01_NODE_4411_length_5051_cov_3.166397_3_plen_128_part_00
MAKELMSGSGVVLIALSLIFTNKEMVFPGWIAILPTVGTAVVIAAGPEALLNKMVIGVKGMAEAGKWSYPLYLWHWPLRIFGSLVLSPGHNMDVTTKLSCILVALLLAIGTVHLIEYVSLPRALLSE